MPFSRPRGDRGASAVEFALVVPILLAVLFSIIDLGFAINRYTVLNNATREGVRAASLSASKSEVDKVVNDSLADLPGAGHRHRLVHDAPRGHLRVVGRQPHDRGCRRRHGDLPARVADPDGQGVVVEPDAVQDQPDEDRVRRALEARAKQERDETGAVAVLVVLLAIVIFACAALAVDISSLAMERQKLHDHVDSAAHAGAFELPASGASAKTWAVTMAKTQDSSMTPDTELFCVVASTGAGKQVASGQIPATCDPGTYSTAQVRCNTKICSIPCPVTARCNTIRVTDSKDVDFDFAPIIGRKKGSTGSVASAACRGSCGETLPNPMDVVFMADRTTSMADDDREDMQTAIVDSLGVMDPTLHYVAFGAMHKSKATIDLRHGGHDMHRTAPRAASGSPSTSANDYRANRDSPISSSSKLVRGRQVHAQRRGPRPVDRELRHAPRLGLQGGVALPARPRAEQPRRRCRSVPARRRRC